MKLANNMAAICRSRSPLRTSTGRKLKKSQRREMRLRIYNTRKFFARVFRRAGDWTVGVDSRNALWARRVS